MRRWNGWGDDSNDFPLRPDGRSFLEERLGKGELLPEAKLKDVLARVPKSRISAHPLISTDAEDRVRHARGQSFGDWIAMRSGEFGSFPDGVAHPTGSSEVRELIDFCAREGVDVIPYGGGTSVVGHLTPRAERPVLSLDVSSMNRLIALDRTSNLATFGAGATGPEVERQLRENGYTLGHFPQSFELSTVGGWVAARSSGQQSLRYGRIEQLFAGGRVETPSGTLEIPTIPASAAGLDVREMVLGSEGRIGVITEVTVRVTPLPEQEDFYVAFMPNWSAGRDLLRRLAQGKVQLSMLRLSDPSETQTHLTLVGKPRSVALLKRYLRGRDLDASMTMLTIGVTGSKVQCAAAMAIVKPMVKESGGVLTGTLLGKRWEETRFRSPYLRNGLWEAGYAVDTLETCTDWNNVGPLAEAVDTALRDGLAGEGERVHVFTHISHVYPQGSSLYTTYVFRLGHDFAQTERRWRTLKAAASEAIVAGGGTISHHHGVGTDHAPYLPAEKGPLGVAAIESVLKSFDPDGIMNPGKLLPVAGASVGAGAE